MFSVNQRWTSETEPELGMGTVVDTGKGRVQIYFAASDETRLYATENAPLRRVLFKPGDSVEDRDGKSFIVVSLRHEEELITYVGHGLELPEVHLGNMPVSHGADDRLLSGHIDAPALFDLRLRTLQNDHRRRLSAIRGFVGGRIDLIPHQLYIAHEVSARQAPRVLLSDEVGLGKTIEACLIVHRLLLSGRAARILVLVPESLVHQWFVEMLRRFNIWMHIFDEERCAAVENGAPDGNPFLDDQLIICSIEFLAGSQKRATQALSASWDLLVVDEAHHLDWSPQKVSREYALVDILSRHAVGLLLLTATPEQLGQESHFARLRLLDPDRYGDFNAFKNEPDDYRTTADLVDRLSTEKKLGHQELESLAGILGADSREIGLMLEADNADSHSVRKEIIEDLLDLHGPGRVMFRNTRSAMSGFPLRNVFLAPIETPTDPEVWIERVRAEFIADMASTPEPSRYDFRKDPRVDWLVSKLQNLNPQKVLLICRSKEKAIALEQAIRERVNIKVSVFHEALSLIQRDRNAAWFSEIDGARLLICSEIGSEGRNFQFTHHLILFDLPLHPELLEQRIGRLDRIGQQEDIQIHVPFLKNSPQEVLARWYHEGLNAFEKNLEGGNQILKLFGKRVCDVALERTGTGLEGGSRPKSSSGFEVYSSPEPLKILLGETASFRSELIEKLAAGRDRLLERNSFRPAVAEKLVEAIRIEDQDATLESFLLAVFEHYHIETEDLAPRTYVLHTRDVTLDAFPSIPEEGITVTFDRKRALRREDISFLSWDHPMVTGAIDLILGSETGNASFAILPDESESSLLLEAIYVLETVADVRMHVDRFLPATPLRVVVNNRDDNVTDSHPVADLARRLRHGHAEFLLENPTITQSIIPQMLKTAAEEAKKQAKLVIAEKLDSMNEATDHEIARLKKLRRVNSHIRPQEIHLAEVQQKNLAEAIESARVRLDSVRLIQMGSV